MSAIDDELKKLLAKQTSADVALKSAAAALVKSQEEYEAAKARETAASQRLAPLQQLTRELESSGAALKQQQTSATREIDDATKLYASVFPAISKEINPVTRKALEDAEAAGKKLEEAIESLRQEIGKTEAARAAAQAEADVAEVQVRERKAELGSLPDRIESARLRLTEKLATVRDAIAANKVGMTFVTLRELDSERTAVTKLADEKAGPELLKKIDAAHTQETAAMEKATNQATILDALRQKLATAEKDLEVKRKATKDARDAIAASQST